MSFDLQEPMKRQLSSCHVPVTLSQAGQAPAASTRPTETSEEVFFCPAA